MDLRVIKLTDIITISSFTYTNLSTPSLLITSADLSTLDYVLINGIKSPSVVILNKSKALVQVPDSEIGKEIGLIAYSYDASNTRRNTSIQIGLGKSTGVTQGQSYLVQKFIKLLLTEKASNAFNSEEGTNFVNVAGLYAPRDESMIKALISNAVRDTESYIRNNQDDITDPSARLLSATLVSVKWSIEDQAVSASVNIIDESGNSINVSTGA